MSNIVHESAGAVTKNLVVTGITLPAGCIVDLQTNFGITWVNMGTDQVPDLRVVSWESLIDGKLFTPYSIGNRPKLSTAQMLAGYANIYFHPDSTWNRYFSMLINSDGFSAHNQEYTTMLIIFPITNTGEDSDTQPEIIYNFNAATKQLMVYAPCIDGVKQYDQICPASNNTAGVVCGDLRGGWHLIIQRARYVGDDNVRTFFVDGVNTGNMIYGTASAASAITTMSLCGVLSTHSFGFMGWLAAFLVYEGALTDGECEILSTYYMTKYGLL